MADTTFVDYTTPAITAEWLNAVNDFYYTLFAGATTAAGARTAIGLVAGGSGDIWVEKAGDTMTGQLTLTYGAPRIDLYDNDTDANKAIWSLTHSNGTLTFQTRLDSGSFQENTLTFNRSGANASDITSIVPLFLSSGTPQLKLIETDASANNGIWSFKADTENLYLQTLNDAESAGNSILEVNRTAEAIDAVKIGTNATSVTAKGSEIITVADYIKAVGNIQSPSLHMPLKNGLEILVGNSVATFSRSTVGTYITRNKVVVDAAINEPRFEEKGLLIEGPSTNDMTYSEDATHANWSKFNCTATGNTTASPDGTTTADTVTDDTATNNHMIGQTYAVTGNTTYTLSTFVKAGTNNYVYLSTNTLSNWVYGSSARFDLSTSTILYQSANANATIKSLANGWFRISITDTTIASPTNAGMWVGHANPADGSSSVYTGDGTATIYVWGMQQEALAFMSSYIRTTTAAVSRTQDVCYVSPANSIPQRAFEQSFLMDVHFLETVTYTNPRAIAAAYSISGEQYRYFRLDASSHYMNLVHGSSVTMTNDMLTDTVQRLGYTFDETTVRTYADGVANNTVVAAPADTPYSSRYYIGANHDGGYPMYGHIANFRIYDKALTAAEMRIA